MSGAFLAEWFKDAQEAAIHAKRIRVGPDDLHHVAKLRGEAIYNDFKHVFLNPPDPICLNAPVQKRRGITKINYKQGLQKKLGVGAPKKANVTSKPRKRLAKCNKAGYVERKKKARKQAKIAVKLPTRSKSSSIPLSSGGTETVSGKSSDGKSGQSATKSSKSSHTSTAATALDVSPDHDYAIPTRSSDNTESKGKVGHKHKAKSSKAKDTEQVEAATCNVHSDDDQHDIQHTYEYAPLAAFVGNLDIAEGPTYTITSEDMECRSKEQSPDRESNASAIQLVSLQESSLTGDGADNSTEAESQTNN